MAVIVALFASRLFVVFAAPTYQELPAPLTDYVPLSITIADDESLLELTRVDFWPSTIVFLGELTMGAENRCIYRSDFVIEIGDKEYKAASRDSIDKEIYPNVETPGSGFFGVCGSNESKVIAIPFDAILSNEPAEFSYGEAVTLLPGSLLEMHDARVASEPTATPTITPTSTPSATPTPSFTPASASSEVVNTANFAVPFSNVARSVAISGEVGNNGIHFYLERIDLWNELPGSRSPRNDLFIVLTGYLLPARLVEGDSCVGGDNIQLLVGSSQYKTSNMREAQRFYDVDFPGYILPQCVAGNQPEPTFFVFDVDLASSPAVLSFHDALLNLNISPAELEAVSIAPSLGVVTPLEESASNTPENDNAPRPIDTSSPTARPELTVTAKITPVLVYVVQDTALYTGPDTSFAPTGKVKSGEFLHIISKDSEGNWYQLDTGDWILGSTLNGIPDNIPVQEPQLFLTHTSPPTNTPRPTSTATPIPTPTPQPTSAWYAGGTLHKATWAEWKQATIENKMATAADWITNAYKPEWQTFAELRTLSTQLVICVDEVADTAIQAWGADSSVVDVVVSCIILMMPEE